MADKVVSLNAEQGIYEVNASAFSLEHKNEPLADVAASNLLKGGQWGHLPLIGSPDQQHEWMADQAYIRRDIIPIVLQAPKGFELMGDIGKKFVYMTKALFEKHARTIEGLDSSITVNSGEHELGLEGAKYREPVNVTVAESNVTISLTEKYGQAVKNFLDIWIRYLIMDPDTKGPLISKNLQYTDKNSVAINGFELNKGVWSTEYYTATVLFIEPDILYSRVVNAWLVSNLYPTSVPNIIGKKDKKADKEIEELSIEFGGFAMHSRNPNVRKLATKVLQGLNLFKLTNESINIQASGVDSVLQKAKEDIYYDQVSLNPASAGTSTSGYTTTEQK